MDENDEKTTSGPETYPMPRGPWLSPHLEVMRSMIRDFNRMFGGWPYPSGLAPLGAVSGWPRIEMFEREGSLVIRAELPWLERDDVKVRVREESLTIEGERCVDEAHPEGYYESNWTYGRFSRTIPLPSGADPDQVRATFRNGILEVTVNLPRPSTREIPIQSEAAGSEPQSAHTDQPTETAGSRERGGTSS